MAKNHLGDPIKYSSKSVKTFRRKRRAHAHLNFVYKDSVVMYQQKYICTLTRITWWNSELIWWYLKTDGRREVIYESQSMSDVEPCCIFLTKDFEDLGWKPKLPRMTKCSLVQVPRKPIHNCWSSRNSLDTRFRLENQVVPNKVLLQGPGGFDIFNA